MPLPSSRIRSAMSRARSMPPAFGVSTSSAPYARIVCAPLDRQVLGHHQHHPVAAHRRHHRERDAGVADVASISVSPGLIVPRFSASTIIDSAGRSLTEPAGLLPSSLASTTLPVRAGQALQPNERRVADGVGEAWMYVIGAIVAERVATTRPSRQNRTPPRGRGSLGACDDAA